MTIKLLSVSDINDDDLSDEWFSCDECIEISRSVAQYIGRKCKWISLNGLESISPDIAEAFAGAEYLGLQGVEQLDQHTATILSACRGLNLSGLTSIAPEVLGALVNVPELRLNGLSKVDLSLARVLSAHRGELNLFGIKCISPQLVQVLRKHHGPVMLGIEKLNAQVADWYVQSHRDALGLSTINSMTNKAAEVLGRFRGDVTLYALPSLSPTQAQSLARIGGCLHLPAVRSIDVEVATAISHCRGGLILDGLLDIDTAVARELAKTQGDLTLRLDGKDVAVARELAAYPNHLTAEAAEMNPVFVRELLGKQASLWLRGLQVLTCDVAKELVQFTSYLYLDIKALDDATASALAAFNGKALSLTRFDYRSLCSIDSLVALLQNPSIDFRKEGIVEWLGATYAGWEREPAWQSLLADWQTNEGIWDHTG
jgi:hypothetical protein